MLYQTHARVYLEKLRSNLRHIRQGVGENRRILITVKANAYGHGAVQVARVAEEMGIDWLGVSTVPEGIQLRKAGIRLPILKLSPAFPEEMQAAIDNEITLTVCQHENIICLQKTCHENGSTLPVHLEVETGMGRIGVLEEEAPGMAKFIESDCPNLVLQGVFTHLPVSDAADPTFTTQQIARFGQVVEAIQTAIGRSLDLVHSSNSGGVLAHPTGWFNMIRPGILVYGYYPSDQTPQTIPVQPILDFVTRVAFIKKVPAGTKIGYGLTWSAPADTWIATIPVGYADGFNRLLSNQGRVLINGRSYPVAGRVCMDLTMIDLGNNHDVQVGDEVILIGKSGSEEITSNELAIKLDTISYEITCQLNSRVERVYLEESLWEN